MADNYLQFSEVVTDLTEQEEAWLKDQLQPVRVFGEKEYPEDAVPAELADKDADWSGVRFLRDKPDHDAEWDALGFEYDFHTDRDTDGWGRHLWLYAEDWGDASTVAWLVQKFLKQFRPDQCWSLTYATTCSKPRAGEFGGGAVFVTADTIRWQNAYQFVEDQRQAFGRKEDTAYAMRRWVLYSIATNMLLTTRTYDSYDEAVADANQVNDILVLPLEFEELYA